MQIRLSQQSLSPSHHFLHSNAFSHLYKIPPSATCRGCAAHFCRLTNRYFCTFHLSSEEMHGRCAVLHALNLHVLPPGLSGDNKEREKKKKKDGRVGRFFFSSPFRCIDLLRCSQQEAARLCKGSVVWMRKVNASFLFKTHSVLTKHRRTWREWGFFFFTCFTSHPSPRLSSPSHVASSAGFMHWTRIFMLNSKFKTGLLIWSLKTFTNPPCFVTNILIILTKALYWGLCYPHIKVLGLIAAVWGFLINLNCV